MLRNDVRLRGQWRWSHWSFIINFLTAAHPALTFDFGCLHDSGEFLRSFPLLLFECVRKEKQLQKYSLFCLPYVSFSAINIFGTELHKRTKMKKKEQEKQNWGDPGEGVWVEQFSSVVHGHVEPLEPIRGQKKWYIIIDIEAAIILTVRSLLCPLQEAQTQTCAWLHSSSVCTVYETFLRYFSLPSTSSPFKFSKHPFTLFTVCFGFLVRFAFLIWTDMLADSHTFTELNIYGSTFKTWWSVLYVFFGSNAAHFCRRATGFPSDHPCLQKLAHNYSGCHCSTAS